MSRLISHQRGTKKQKSIRLWGMNFDIVENGLDEEQVIRFVDDLLRQREASSSASSQVPAREGKNTATESDDMGTREASPESNIAIEEKLEDSAQHRDDVIISKLSEAIPEEPSESRFPGNRLDREETEPGLPQKDGKSLYSDQVELTVPAPIDLKMISNLYQSLQTIPELRILHTIGSLDMGTTITVVLDRPIPLVSIISTKTPNVEVIPEPHSSRSLSMARTSPLLEKGGGGAKRIKIVPKEGSARSRG